MSSHTSLLLLITLWASVQHGLGLPVMKRSETDASDGGLALRTRTKRCACSSQLDFECHYFCHLDIIWVNTASKTTVYGLGGVLTRCRRSAGRCTCTTPNDVTCINFCRHSSVASKPKKVSNSAVSERDESSEAQGEDAR